MTLPPLDVMAAGQGLRETAATAGAAERAGFDGLWLTEGGRTSFGAATAAALGTESLTVGTGIAVAFARSPMIAAAAARELQEATGGRFILGLGTQVRAHVERRYSAEFDRPGPRLREYVEAVRAIWRSFRGEERLRYQGEFYNFSLMTPEWSPGPTELPDPEIYLAGVNPWMLRMIGEVGDGLHVHPLHSIRYLDEVVRPHIAEGAARAGRDPGAIALVVPVMTAAGDTDAEIDAERAKLRLRLAFYGSTPGYAKVFETHGWDDLQPRLNRLFAGKDRDGMAAAITDEVLDALTVTAHWDGLADALATRYRGAADRLVAYSAVGTWKTPGNVERWAAVAADWRKLAAQ
ncbi:TIGR03617 family F420-dependent LLM class oxidoreductase [Yinghuangia soli]|uniref:TIGR03617 family F420-dependent LLM class oxidoreductase n=1 Tax=Yinghuangia soli TaxID=2908204 RepID=A0AA41U1G2_9ACTN|nr:TIGR03617 family F420-dependent LLM class oxidoreductase [Yinghuangia soli]MCF2526109.1 TIGR03617 family F420-dependent LLM class oxidoreductase [Yinghuangia soli]